MADVKDPKLNAKGKPRKQPGLRDKENKIVIDETQLRALMRLKPTREDCAAFFKVHPDTIDNRIKRLAGKDKTFSEFREENMVHTRFSLIREAQKQALNGNTAMLIFCLKNLCGWVDKVEHGVDQNQMAVVLRYNLEEAGSDVVDITPTKRSD